MSQKVTLYMALLSLIPPPTLSGLNQLCELIDFYEHAKHTASCVMYDYYGCWCGPGGSGKPVDETDQCCQAHDYCYDKIIAEKEVPYFHQYNWHNGTCDDAPGTVLYKICDCDRTIAICLSQHKFNWKHWGSRFWPGYCEDNRKQLEKFRFV